MKRRKKRHVNIFIYIKPIHFQLKHNSFGNCALKQYYINLHLFVCRNISLKSKCMRGRPYYQSEQLLYHENTNDM